MLAFAPRLLIPSFGWLRPGASRESNVSLEALADGASQLHQSVLDSLASVPEPAGDPNGEILKAAFEDFTAIMRESDKLLGQVAASAERPAKSLEDGASQSPWAKW
jgi:hypothetical protein